jgi:hypothetical protein
MLVGAPAVAIATHRESRVGCRPGAGRLVVADRQAQVYLGRERIAFGTLPAYKGCVFGRKRSFSLGGPPEGSSQGAGGTRQLTLAGTVVAYEGFSTETGGVEESIILARDLRSGKRLHKAPTGTPSVPNANRVGIGAATALVVKPDGAVAWIVATAEASRYQVHAIDKTGSRELAAGPDIAPESLALAGSTLYWTQGGRPMSARLN